MATQLSRGLGLGAFLIGPEIRCLDGAFAHEARARAKQRTQHRSGEQDHREHRVDEDVGMHVLEGSRSAGGAPFCPAWRPSNEVRTSGTRRATMDTARLAGPCPSEPRPEEDRNAAQTVASPEQDDPRSRDLRFRPLRKDDLPRMHRWLNDPAVVRWWEGADVSWPAVVRRYQPERWGRVEHWIALDAEQPFGWLQCYCAADMIDGETYYWQDHVELGETAGIDYFVGEATRRTRGLGSAMIRAFVRDVVFGRHPEWRFAAAGPFEANVPSWRALENAGFRRRAVLDDKDGPCVLMVASRADYPDADVG